MKNFFKTHRVTVLHTLVLFFTLALFFLVAPMPLLGTLGFESANLYVTIFGPFFCLVASLNPYRASGFNRIIKLELLWLLAHIGFLFALLFLNGFSAQSCSQGAGIVPFLTIIIPPLLLNVGIGALLASLMARGYLRVLTVIGGYACYFALVAYCWWQEANFRLLTHASFLMSSDLIQGDSLTPPVVGFRIATLLLALAVIYGGTCFLNPGSKILNKKPFLALTIIALLLTAHGFLSVKSKEMLGKDKAALRQDYRLLAEKNGLKIFADPKKTNREAAQAILLEALFYQEKLKKSLGEISSQPITIWLHHSDQEKFLYTGAQNVHFALPKHREIHIAGYKTPHDVLGHELAHIYVGEQSPHFFGLVGSKFIPNMALTEGLAMVLSQELNLDNNLSLLEQAKAIYHAKLRIDPERLLSSNPLAFALSNPRASYIYAGAILENFFKDIPKEKLPATIKALIRAGSIDGIFKNSEDKAKALAQFNQELKKDISQGTRLWSEKNFSKKTSILASDCREKSENKRQDFMIALQNNDHAAALAFIEGLPLPERPFIINKAVDQLLEAQAFPLALDLLNALPVKKDDHADGEHKLKKVESLVGLNRFAEAKAIFDSIDETQFLSQKQRLYICLSAFFAEAPDDFGRSAIAFLLSRPANLSYRLANFAHHFGQVSKSRSDLRVVVADYLLARLFASPQQSNQGSGFAIGFMKDSLVNRERYDQALKLMDKVLEKPSLLPRSIERESRRIKAFILYNKDQNQAAIASLKDLVSDSATKAERLELLDQIERMSFMMRQSGSVE